MVYDIDRNGKHILSEEVTKSRPVMRKSRSMVPPSDLKKKDIGPWTSGIGSVSFGKANQKEKASSVTGPRTGKE